MPTTETSLFARPLVSITRFCVRNPRTVLLLGIALALLGTVAAIGNLGFKTSRLDLINPKSGFNQLWLKYIEEFGDCEDMIVVVEGKTADEIAPVLDRLSELIGSQQRLFQSALQGVDVSKIRQKGLHYVSTNDLKTLNAFASEAQEIVQRQWIQLNIGNMLDSLRLRLEHPEMMRQYGGKGVGAVSEPLQSPEQLRARTLQQLNLVSHSLAQAFASQPIYNSPWSQMQGEFGAPEVVGAGQQNETGYFILPGIENENVMGFVLVRPVEVEHTEFAQGTEAVEKLREIIRATQNQYPDLQIGLTGLPVMENDEMRLSQEAMSKASIISLIGVSCIFFAGFGGLRHPLFAIIALLIGLSWTIGYVVLAVGHLNILSISFGVILIGLGTDFSVHYLARYMQLRKSVRSPQEAIVQTAGTVGPGVIAGALTTAIAFFMAAFAEFTGIVELGIISGGGVLLCAIATILIVPVFIQLADGTRPLWKMAQPIDVYHWVKPLFAFPRLTLLVTITATVVLATGISQVWYDHNLLHLQPEGLESVELEQKLLKSGQNAWYALSIADNRETLLKRKEEFAQKYPELRVAEIVSMIPGYDPTKQPYIASIAQVLAPLPERPQVVPLSHPDTIVESITALQQVLQTDSQSREIIRNLSAVRDALRRMSLSDCYHRMQDYQNAVSGDLLSRLHLLRGIANPNPPEWSDLPESFVSRFVSKGGKHLMRIYSDADIWNMDEMEVFVKKVRSIDPQATGSPLQTYESSLQMQRGYQTASIYALFAITVILLIDFRSLKDTLLALSPMMLGLAQMLGFMGLLGIPFNPANTIAIPLILGIGIDDGVHIIHDYRLQKGRFRMTASTASSVLIVSLTTIVGFGSLMISSHQGVQSLGRVLVIGVTSCLFSSLVILPAFLVWWSHRREEREQEQSEVEVKVETGFVVLDDTGFDLRSDTGPLAYPYVYEEDQETCVGIRTETTSTGRMKRLKRRDVA